MSLNSANSMKHFEKTQLGLYLYDAELFILALDRDTNQDSLFPIAPVPFPVPHTYILSCLVRIVPLVCIFLAHNILTVVFNYFSFAQNSSHTSTTHSFKIDLDVKIKSGVNPLNGLFRKKSFLQERKCACRST